jgi:signal transduction histidine kinase
METNTFALVCAIAFISLIALVSFSCWKKAHITDRIKFDFISVIVHKFRTPLTSARWATEELLSRETDPEKKSLIQAISTSHERLSSLMSTLIDLANVDTKVAGPLHMTQYDIGTVLRSVIDQFKSSYLEKGIALSVHFPDQPVMVRMDVEQISFVVQTLLENAYHYSDQGRVNVVLSSSQKYIQIAVSDTGIGMSSADLGHAFHRSYRSVGAKQADPDGFGIGLYLSRRIVVRHGGHITVTSGGLGKGSTFTVVLPAKK